jgi:hypothetical protein
MSEIISRINARLAVGYPLCAFFAFRSQSVLTTPIMFRPEQGISRSMWSFEPRSNERETSPLRAVLPETVRISYFNSYSTHRVYRIAAKLIVNSGADIGAMARHLQPVIACRLNEQRLHGSEWPGKPVSHAPLFFATMFNPSQFRRTTH